MLNKKSVFYHLLTIAGLNKFARLARSVTRNRTMLQQVASATPTQSNVVTSPDWNLLTPEMAEGRHGRSTTSRTPSPHPADDHCIHSPAPKTQADLEKGASVS